MSHRSWPPELALPQSAEGQLQRGHGTIARTILVGGVPEARDMVLGCIRLDPRWDSQLDARADYYAILGMAVQVSMDEIAALIAADEAEPFEFDPGACLALDVLLSCAARDYPDALDATRDYIAHGRYWSQAVVALVDDRSTNEPRPDWRDRVQGVPGVLKSRWPSFDSLVETFRNEWDFDARRTPWREWADEDPELASALREARPPRPPQPSARERTRGLATEDLLALAGSGNLRDIAQILANRTTERDVAAMRAVASDPSVPMHAAAVSALAVGEHVDVLPAILALTEETRPRAVHALLFRALGALPYEATRGTVLEWLQGNDSSRRRAAASAIAKHAITDDVPLLRQLLGVELDAGAKGEQYLVCSYAEGLGRQPALGPYPELDRAFIEMPYSYGRRFVVDALVATDPTFPAVRAVDCLWDAEPAIRATAAKVVDVRNQEAASRLQVLAADPAEEPDVRSAADRANR